MSSYYSFSFKSENSLLVVAAILCVPLFDMLRVIGVRLLNGKSPFFPDRNHTHHILIDNDMSHFNASMLLGFINYIMVILFVWLSSKISSVMLLLILVAAFGSFLIVFDALRKNIKKKSALAKQEA